MPGDDDTWAILVHGRGAARDEALRSLAVVADLGLPALVISYRNDGIGPATDDGVGHFGAEEWHDLDAATTYALDALDEADELEVPILLFHGTADVDVPVGTSDALAAARPELVTYVRLPGVGHVRSWNANPEGYERELRSFVEKYALG